MSRPTSPDERARNAALAETTPASADPASATTASATTASATTASATTASATTAGAGAAAGEHGDATRALPRQIGRYRIERQLGAGGMGVVYAARDPQLDRAVALKLLKTSSTEDARMRLQREARAMAQLAHPNVVTVHEVSVEGGLELIVMELVDGESIAEWLAAAPRSPDEILDAFRAAGRGLAAAHAVGLVHRDFKPQNVLRSRQGRVMVADFGLARVADGTPASMHGARAGARDAPPALTATGSLLGTPAYMAPEQWEGGEITAAIDQFAFCVSLWEALAGARPFRGATLDELREAILRGPAALAATNLPRQLAPVLRRGLERDPARRWPSMDALLAALSPARPRRAWLVPAAAALASAAAATVVITMLVSRDDGPTARRGRVTRGSAMQTDATDAAAVLAQVTKFAKGRVTAPPAAIQRLVTALRERREARFVASVKDGQQLGYKLFAVRPGSILDAVGLVNADVITAIDDHPTQTEAQLAAATEALPDSPARITLHVQRASEPVAIVVSAKP